MICVAGRSVVGSGIPSLSAALSRKYTIGSAQKPGSGTALSLDTITWLLLRCTVVAMRSSSPECYKACTSRPYLVQTHHLRSRPPDVFSTYCPRDFRQVSSPHYYVKQSYSPDSVTVNYVLIAALGKPVGSFMWGLVVVSPFQTGLLVYDTLLTFLFEIKYIWRKKLKLGSVLYILARYPAVLLLTPLPQFKTLKVSSYIPRNGHSSRKRLVRISFRLTQCLTPKQCMQQLGSLHC